MTEKGKEEKTEYKVKSLKERKAEIKAEKAASRKAARKKGVVNRWIRSFSGDTLRNICGSDSWVIFLVFALSTFGVIMVFSAGYYQTINTADPNPTYYLYKQLAFVLLGWVFLAIAANIDYHIYLKSGEIALIGSIALLVLVLMIGSSSHNAQRWITILGVRITPSELSKLAVIIFTSAFLIKHPRGARSFTGLGILFIVMGVHFGLIVRQPNLSTAIVIVMIMFAIMIVAGMNILMIALPGAAAIAGYFYIIRYKTPYHWYQRLTSFADPFADIQGDGYQVSQGLIALGNGGLKGMGFGRSITKNMYLPEPQNDFILAIIGEELGYIGFLVLMAVYIVLLFRLFLIALRAKDRLGFYLATGVAVMLGLQVIINIAVVTSSMPATGITLPFISYGGTSILVFMMSMGIALNISKSQRKPGKGKERMVEK